MYNKWGGPAFEIEDINSVGIEEIEDSNLIDVSEIENDSGDVKFTIDAKGIVQLITLVDRRVEKKVKGLENELKSTRNKLDCTSNIVGEYIFSQPPEKSLITKRCVSWLRDLKRM